MKIGRVTLAVSVPQVGSIVLENIELTPEEFKNVAELLGITATKTDIPPTQLQTRGPQA